MGSPDRSVRKYGVKAALAGAILLAAANRLGVVKIGESNQSIPAPASQPLETPERSHEVEIISENLSFALRWLSLKRDPLLDQAIVDIAKIQGLIYREGNTKHIADLDSSALDSKYAEVIPTSNENGGALIIALSEEKFTDPAFNRAEAAKDLLIAWRIYERTKKDPQRFINDDTYRDEVEILARDFVDSQLATH